MILEQNDKLTKELHKSEEEKAVLVRQRGDSLGNQSNLSEKSNDSLREAEFEVYCSPDPKVAQTELVPYQDPFIW